LDLTSLLELTSHNKENKDFLDEIDKTYSKIDTVNTKVRQTEVAATTNQLALTKANVQIHTLLVIASNYYQSVWIQIKE
ncbi:hypothetical protein, partial [Lactococcus cremoris]|uniref:hypothetical protein n=2 Tax=Lactococcus lactis subsp. cremoris TaxID=1359 RepID=UPI0024A67C86